MCVYVCMCVHSEGQKVTGEYPLPLTWTHTHTHTPRCLSLCARSSRKVDLCQVARVFTVTETHRPRKHKHSKRGRASWRKKRQKNRDELRQKAEGGGGERRWKGVERAPTEGMAFFLFTAVRPHRWSLLQNFSTYLDAFIQAVWFCLYLVSPVITSCSDVLIIKWNKYNRRHGNITCSPPEGGFWITFLSTLHLLCTHL